jgi:hypothetical protein
MKALLFVALISSALVSGLTLTHVLQDPGSRGLDGASWLTVQHTFYGGFAVLGGVGEIVSVITAGALGAWLIGRRYVADAVRALIAAAALLGTLVAYFVGNRPVNALVAHWTPATLPPDWTTYRNTWEIAHAISAALSLTALVLLAVSAVWCRAQLPDRASSAINSTAAVR